jgi:hypothetical protein
MNLPLADHVVDALIAERLVEPAARRDSIAVVAGVLGSGEHSPGAADASSRRSLPQLVEVVAYLGGALVLSAGGLFLVQQWGDLGFGARTALLAVVTAVLTLAGVVSSRVPAGQPSLREDNQAVRRRLAGALLTGAALAGSCLVGYVLDEWGDFAYPAVYWPAVAGAAVGVLVAGVGYRIAPTALGLLAMMAGVVTVAINVVETFDDNEGDAIGVLLFLIGAVWLGLTEMGLFREVTVARALGVATALVGAQVPVMDGTHSWLGYLLTVLVAVVGIAVYLGRVDWPYLAGAVIAVTLVVPEAVSDWTGGSLGAVGGVLVAGVTLLVASYAGYRVRAEAIT